MCCCFFSVKAVVILSVSKNKIRKMLGFFSERFLMTIGVNKLYAKLFGGFRFFFSVKENTKIEFLRAKETNNNGKNISFRYLSFTDIHWSCVAFILYRSERKMNSVCFLNLNVVYNY